MIDESALRRQMAAAMLKLERLGLNRGMSGNLGARCGKSFMVTPSAIAPHAMMPEDMVMMDFNGEAHAAANPTSEWRIHRDVLHARDDAGAVVHTHSPFATALACLGKDVPAFHYMMAVAGGDSIRCAPYALFGTQELSNLALEALEERRACLLANHGLVAVGADLSDAVALALEVETLCEQYWRSMQIGTPALLSREQMREVLARFADYRRTNDKAS